jgi:hypothetical protein
MGVVVDNSHRTDGVTTARFEVLLFVDRHSLGLFVDNPMLGIVDAAGGHGEVILGL